jgi:hypothetical protein
MFLAVRRGPRNFAAALASLLRSAAPGARQVAKILKHVLDEAL